jgi:hypothetical protein
VNVAIGPLFTIGESTSIGLVQKCGGSGTVLPRHSTTRARTSVIFIVDQCSPVFCQQCRFDRKPLFFRMGSKSRA